MTRVAQLCMRRGQPLQVGPIWFALNRVTVDRGDNPLADASHRQVAEASRQVARTVGPARHCMCALECHTEA